MRFSLQRPSLADLHVAWQWASARPVFFPHSGGYLTWDSYLIWSQRDGRHNTAVMADGILISVVTVELTGAGEYLFHVTSPKRSDLDLIANAAYQVSFQLFRDLGARTAYTHCPTVDGHLHRGSRALCEGCGARPCGVPEEEEIKGHRYSWQTYQLTRADWLENHYGREK